MADLTSEKPRGFTKIEEGLKVEGSVLGKGNMTLGGELKGNIEISGDLSIEATGKVVGDCVADAVTVGGHVKGNVHAKRLVTVAATGVVNGDIYVPRITIADGATVYGKLNVERPND